MVRTYVNKSALPSKFGNLPMRPRRSPAFLAYLDKEALQGWIMRRPFAAVLPIQPMLVTPLEPPPLGVSLLFRRKPSDEKGGTDGGSKVISGLALECEGADRERERGPRFGRGVHPGPEHLAHCEPQLHHSFSYQAGGDLVQRG